MRTMLKNGNGNGKRETCRMDWKSMRERCNAMRIGFERKNGNGKRERDVEWISGMEERYTTIMLGL